jgi:hypothetical protein
MRRRNFDSDSEAEEKSQTEIGVEMMKRPPRYVIYVAGLEPNLNSIAQLYRVFQRFGQIITIEIIVSEKVTFIEFPDLLSAFKAVVTRKSPLQNRFVKIGFAVDPDQQDLEALEADRQRSETAWKQLNAAKVAQVALPDNENMLRDDVVEKTILIISQMEAETDPVKKEEYRRKLDELNSITSDL